MTEMTTNDVTNDYVSGELRLSGQMNWIDWIVGAFYYEADGFQHAVVDQPRTGLIRYLNNSFKPVSKAVYANATVRPFDNGLSITGGLRYSDDKKVVSLSNLVEDTPNPTDIQFDVAPQATVLSWKLGLNYELGNDMLLYASAATGYTLPGYNARPQQPSQIAQFDGNENVAYEIGAKIDLFDRRLRLNIAGFYTDFSKRPLALAGQEILLDVNGNPTAGNQVVIPLPEGPDGSTTCRVRTAQEVASNVPGYSCITRSFYKNTPANIKGFEAEMTAEPIDGLVLNGALGYHKFSSPDVDRRAINPRQPEPFWSASAGLQYTIEGAPLGGTITPRVDWSYQGSTAPSTRTTAWNQPGYSLVNARLTYALRDEGFSLALGVTNLFDQLHYDNYFILQDSGQSNVQGQPNAPRQWYLTLSKDF
jgi:iron complex outermembrane receptor protein